MAIKISFKQLLVPHPIINYTFYVLLALLLLFDFLAVHFRVKQRTDQSSYDAIYHTVSFQCK